LLPLQTLRKVLERWSEGSRDGTVVRALASHRCGSGSIPGLDAKCRLSLLLVLFSAPRGFSPGTQVFPSPPKPTFPNSNSIQISVDEYPLCGGATANSHYYYYYEVTRALKSLVHFLEETPKLRTLKLTIKLSLC